MSDRGSGFFLENQEYFKEKKLGKDRDFFLENQEYFKEKFLGNHCSNPCIFLIIKSCETVLGQHIILDMHTRLRPFN